MNSCTLALAMPALRVSLNGSIISEDSHVAAIDVWALDTPSNLRLDFQTLSYNNKPRRAKNVGTLTAPTDGTELPRFDCVWGTYYTFELSCKGCYVDFSNAEDSARGMHWADGLDSDRTGLTYCLTRILHAAVSHNVNITMSASAVSGWRTVEEL